MIAKIVYTTKDEHYEENGMPSELLGQQDIIAAVSPYFQQDADIPEIAREDSGTFGLFILYLGKRLNQFSFLVDK